MRVFIHSFKRKSHVFTVMVVSVSVSVASIAAVRGSLCVCRRLLAIVCLYHRPCSISAVFFALIAIAASADFSVVVFSQLISFRESAFVADVSPSYLYTCMRRSRRRRRPASV